MIFLEHNFEYPDFFLKLYRLLTDEVVYSNHRVRFFHLIDLFLASPKLPLSYQVKFFTCFFEKKNLETPIQRSTSIFQFLYKFPFVTKVSMVEKSFDFIPNGINKFPFLMEILIFEENVWFLTKISIFDQKFRFLRKNVDFWPKISILEKKFRFLTKNFDSKEKISIVEKKFRFLRKNFDFWPKISILEKTIRFLTNNLEIILIRVYIRASLYGFRINMVALTSWLKCVGAFCETLHQKKKENKILNLPKLQKKPFPNFRLHLRSVYPARPSMRPRRSFWHFYL